MILKTSGTIWRMNHHIICPVLQSFLASVKTAVAKTDTYFVWSRIRQLLQSFLASASVKTAVVKHTDTYCVCSRIRQPICTQKDQRTWYWKMLRPDLKLSWLTASIMILQKTSCEQHSHTRDSVRTTSTEDNFSSFTWNENYTKGKHTWCEI